MAIGTSTTLPRPVLKQLHAPVRKANCNSSAGIALDAWRILIRALEKRLAHTRLSSLLHDASALFANGWTQRGASMIVSISYAHGICARQNSAAGN